MGDLVTDGYLNMVCIKSAHAADNEAILAPGAEHRLRMWARRELSGGVRPD